MGHAVETRIPTFRRVYVWELPVRLYHWVNAASVVALIVTGFVIGAPTTIAYSSEAYEQYWFGTVRFVHFTAGYIFCFNQLVRLYWGFVGNSYSRWNTFIPHTRAQFREIRETLLVDILEFRRHRGRYAVGHNALAGLTYFVTFLVFLFQVFTGFALYSSMSTASWTRLFDWTVPLMGGDFAVRQWHHIMMWFFVVFTIIHVYLVFYHDYVEGRGTTSSMIGGWKFERSEFFDDSADKKGK